MTGGDISLVARRQVRIVQLTPGSHFEFEGEWRSGVIVVRNFVIGELPANREAIQIVCLNSIRELSAPLAW